MELLILAVPSVMTKAGRLSWEQKFRLKLLILRLREGAGAGGGDEEGEEEERERSVDVVALPFPFIFDTKMKWKLVGREDACTRLDMVNIISDDRFYMGLCVTFSLLQPQTWPRQRIKDERTVELMPDDTCSALSLSFHRDRPRFRIFTLRCC